jgi:hypothetical protein
MSSFVKDILSAVEDVVTEARIPVRHHFPINLVSKSVGYVPHSCVVEVLITKPLNKQRLTEIDHFFMEFIGRIGSLVHIKYWPPLARGGTGSIIVSVKQSLPTPTDYPIQRQLHAGS